ncbi:oxidoreductase [Paraphotobacterium marinum]|uniref:NADH-quinone oxidoreductase subunit M n=1 Tax=Paraphotobacterium marinum TaxID=1755811 RepID=A0A220VDC0_9GAMM|nr:NADH-quinone oxidoreductase subunit M [Paraphotobacterium marinum]ASK78394.1 oxidoreductase [Paraphotobacterium marinum]
MFFWLNFIIYFPLISAIFIWLGCNGKNELARSLTLSVVTVETLILTFMYLNGAFPLNYEASWMHETLGFNYVLRLDGFSLALILLTSFLGVISTIVSWERVKNWGSYGPLLLGTITGLVGVFTAYDLILFYTFWEIMLIPIYFMLSFWGDKNSKQAALKFIIVTVFSSLLMLLGLIFLCFIHYAETNEFTLNILDLINSPIKDVTAAKWIFAAMFIAFAVKIPLFPFHFWAPDTYKSGEPGAIILLSGAMANAGIYGVIRFCVPLFPEVSSVFVQMGMALGAFGTVYAALLAIKQTNIRSVFAYSSISHMNIIVVAIFAWQIESLNGAALQLIAHGISIAGLFTIVSMLLDRNKDGNMQELGGLFKKMPALGLVFLVYIVATIGMPGLANFTGEALILAGSFKVSTVWPSLAAISILLSVIYGVRVYGKSMWGPLKNADTSTLVLDLNAREKAMSAMLIILLFFIGLYPNIVLEPIHNSIATLMKIGL